MREIKFRIVYNNKILGYEKIVNGDWQWMCPELNPDGGERWTNGSFPSTAENHYKTLRDQYTGIPDRNGKEIYEGDVFDKDGDDDFHGFVEWDKDHWAINWGNNHIEPFSDFHMHGFLVIGNIYEHPHLLTTQQG